MALNQAGSTTEQLQDLLLESAGMTEFLQALTTISAPLLGPDALCTITVEPVTAPATAASSTDAGRPDEKQREADDEPCLTAPPEQHTVLIRQLHIEDRWHRHLISEGHRSVLSVRIPTDAALKAALYCYSPHADAFSPDTVASVQKHAASLSGILRLALRDIFLFPETVVAMSQEWVGGPAPNRRCVCRWLRCAAFGVSGSA